MLEETLKEYIHQWVEIPAARIKAEKEEK